MSLTMAKNTQKQQPKQRNMPTNV